MEIRREQRTDYPPEVENIGLGNWHVRWDVEEVIAELEDDEDEVTSYHEYNEVTLDHEPTDEEIEEITAQ